MSSFQISANRHPEKKSISICWSHTQTYSSAFGAWCVFCFLYMCEWVCNKSIGNTTVLRVQWIINGHTIADKRKENIISSAREKPLREQTSVSEHKIGKYSVAAAADARCSTNDFPSLCVSFNSNSQFCERVHAPPTVSVCAVNRNMLQNLNTTK